MFTLAVSFAIGHLPLAALLFEGLLQSLQEDWYTVSVNFLRAKRIQSLIMSSGDGHEIHGQFSNQTPVQVLLEFSAHKIESQR